MSTREESPALVELRALVQRVWGYSELRPLQAEAMLAALAGRDSLVVLATGGGKSLCYQAPALARDGLTCVISPLISLMQDQVAGLIESGVPAVMLTSAQDATQRRAAAGRLASGEVKLLFVAPERLVMPGFFDELAKYGLAALVIDEAHCISHWGHDFRPEYRRIGELRARWPGVPMHAFTATATPQVRRDIAAQLALRDPVELVGGFDRPNLTYRFLPRGDTAAQVLGVIRRHADEAGIVYCLRRSDVDSLAAALAKAGVRCLPYHAGLDGATRERNQARFLAEAVDVIVATVAFGMGIDRPDVRFVVHASLPKGVEQFAQETGRAGRDGAPSECVMLYAGADYYGWRSLAERSAQESAAAGAPVDPEEQARALARLGEMYGFATSAVCRHRFLVEHFGQAWQPPEDASDGCGACDVCLRELSVLADSQRTAQMILSCVARCGQRWGAQHIADVLRGGDTERIRAAGHDQLSTFALLKAHPSREIRHWIDQLVALGHLRVADGQFPTLALSESGVEAMRARVPVTLFAMPATPAKPKRSRSGAGAAADGAPLDFDDALFQRLRALRRRLAAERGVPPYLIFGDRTLQELAAAKPTRVEQLRGIRGIGEVKLRDLGAVFAAEIAAAVAQTGGAN
ncbi:MAG TPA: RecQ family ATP-dependent DNA helicase [Myxococcota bacterium]|jgi:ATP-dependent DNA helicase RecQ